MKCLFFVMISSWFSHKTASYNRTATLLQLTSFCYCCGPSCAQEGGFLPDQSKRQWTHGQKHHHSQRDQKSVVPLPSSATTSSTSFFFSSAAPLPPCCLSCCRSLLFLWIGYSGLNLVLVSCLLLGQRQLDRCGTLKGLSFERTIGKNSSTIIVLEWRRFFHHHHLLFSIVVVVVVLVVVVIYKHKNRRDKKEE